jgi:hypothetical protein
MLDHNTGVKHGDTALSLRFAFETDADRPALVRLAERLGAGGSNIADWPRRFSWNRLPGPEGTDYAFPVRRRRLLAWQGEEIRGSVNLFENELYLARRSEPIAFAWSNGLFSESVVDRRYALVPILLLRVALARQPRQMSVGFGGAQEPMSKLLTAAGWTSQAVPLLLLTVRAAVVVRELRRLSRYPALLAGGRAAAAIGLTALADMTLAGLRRLRFPRHMRIEEVDRFAGWSDEVWSAAQPSYGALVRRDAAALDRLYRPGDRRLIRLTVSDGDRVRGWIALTVEDKVDDPDYGTLRLGVLADCLAPPGYAGALIAAGVDRLVAAHVDLIQVRFSHAAWIAAARRSGFVPVPTSTRFFVSPALAGDVPPLPSIHLTYGDNDGPLPHEQSSGDPEAAMSGYRRRLPRGRRARQAHSAQPE